MQRFTKIVAAGILTTSMSVMAGFADTVRIAFVDPLSAPFATTGTNGLAEYEFAAEELVNKKAVCWAASNLKLSPLTTK